MARSAPWRDRPRPSYALLAAAVITSTSSDVVVVVVVVVVVTNLLITSVKVSNYKIYKREAHIICTCLQLCIKLQLVLTIDN
jgi:hypothetical protein